MKTFRILRVLALLALAGLLVAGCVRDPLRAVNPNQQDVTFWYQHTGEGEQEMQALIRDFNASNQWGITVTGEFAGSYAEIYRRMLQCIPIGTCPDLAVAYQNQAAMYAKLDGVVELTPYLESGRWGFTKQELADFFPFVSQGDYLPQFKGRYGFPPQRSMEVLYYNEDWLRALGYNAPPSTWDEFAEMSCAASHPAVGNRGYEMAADASTFADMVVNRGGAMLDKTAEAYAFGDQAGLDVLTGLQALFKQGCAVLEEESDGDQENFGRQKALFIISSTRSLPTVRQNVGSAFNWSISTLPTTLTKPRVNVYGASLSVFRSTPEKQLAAWLFIKWLTEPEQGARWTRATDYFPVRKSVKASLEAAGYLAQNPQFAKALGFLDNDIAIEPGVVGYDECRAEILEMLTAVAKGADPASSLAGTIEQCNDYLEQGAPAP